MIFKTKSGVIFKSFWLYVAENELDFDDML